MGSLIAYLIPHQVAGRHMETTWFRPTLKRAQRVHMIALFHAILDYPTRV